jgi:hypothetical protein
MNTCANCGKDNETAAEFCAACHCSLVDPPADLKKLPWAMIYAVVGLIIGILGTGYLAFFMWCDFTPHHYVETHLDYPDTVWFWKLVVRIISVITLVLGLPGAMVALVKKQRLIGWLGVVFALAPCPLGMLYWKLVMHD